MFCFHLVPTIVGGHKYFDISREEVGRALHADEHIECITEHQVGDDVVNLKLNIQCKRDYPESWTISLKLHQERIDGIDHQLIYSDKNGKRCKGWHRNTWDSNKKKASIHEPLIDFKFDSIDQFLVRSLGTMKIILNKVDHEYSRSARLFVN